MTTTNNPPLDGHSDGTQPSNVLRWSYTVIAIALAGVTAYLVMYSIGILVGGSQTVAWGLVQLLIAVVTGALCVVSSRFAARHTPKPATDASS